MKSLNLLKKSKNRSFIGGFIGSFFGILATFSAQGGVSAETSVAGSSTDKYVKITGTGSYNWTAPANSSNFRVLIVGGGGSGGNGLGGGGGAGGFYDGSLSLVSGTQYMITVGKGGSYGANENGGSSSIGNLKTVIGGGAGGTGDSHVGQSGGSGGGGQGYGSSSEIAGGFKSGSDVGNGGGSGSWVYASGSGHAGGGGGAGGEGVAGSTTKAGAGGGAKGSDIMGTTEYFAAGGGGGTNQDQGQQGAGGSNGGGEGGYLGRNTTMGTDGSNASGYGCGGGGAGGGKNGGAGSDGIVIIRYTLGSPTPAGNAYIWDAGSVANKTWNTPNNWTKKSGYPSQSTDVAIYSKASDALTYVDATHSFGILTNNAPNKKTIIYGNSGDTDKLNGQLFYAAADTTTIFSNGVKATFYPSADWAEQMLKSTAAAKVDPNNPSFMGDRAEIIATGAGTVLTISGSDNGKTTLNQNTPGHNTSNYVLRGEDQKLIAENGATLILSNMNYASCWQAAQENRVLQGTYYTVTNEYGYQKLRRIQHTVTGTSTRMMLQWYLDDQAFGHPAAEFAKFEVSDGATLEFLTDDVGDHDHHYAFNAGGMSRMDMVVSNATVISHGYLQLSPSEEVPLFLTDSDAYYHTVTMEGKNPLIKFDKESAALEGYMDESSSYKYDESGSYGIRMGRYTSNTHCNLSLIVEPEWADKSTARIISESTPNNTLTKVSDKNKNHQQSWFQMGRNSKLKIDVSHLNYASMNDLVAGLENTVGASNVKKLDNGNPLIPLIRHGYNATQGSFIWSSFMPEIIYPDGHQWVVRLVHMDADGSNYQVWKNDQSDRHKNAAGVYYLEFYRDEFAFAIKDYAVPYLGLTNDYYTETHDFTPTSDFIEKINIHSVTNEDEKLDISQFDIEFKDINDSSLTFEHQNLSDNKRSNGTLAYTEVGELIIVAKGKSNTDYTGRSATSIFKITPARLVFTVKDYHLDRDRDLDDNDLEKISTFDSDNTLDYGYTRAGSHEQNESALLGLKLAPSGNITVNNNWNASGHTDAVLTLPEIEYRNYTVEKNLGEITFEENKKYSIYYYKPENAPNVEGPKITVAGTWWKEAYPGLFNQAGTKVKDVDGNWYDFIGSEATSKWYESLQREFMKTNTWGVAGWEAYILGFDGSQVSNACVVTSISQYGQDKVLIELKDMPTGKIPEEKDGFELQGKHTTQLQLTSATVSDNTDGYIPLAGAVKGRTSYAWPNWIISTADAANNRFRLRVLYDFGNIKTGSN